MSMLICVACSMLPILNFVFAFLYHGIELHESAVKVPSNCIELYTRKHYVS